MKKGNKEVTAEVNLHLTRVSHLSQSYTSQLYQNAQVNQNMKLRLVWSKKLRSYFDEVNN